MAAPTIPADPSTATTLPLPDLVQVGDPMAHGGVVVWPLFPRTQPHSAYLTLEEALPRVARDERVLLRDVEVLLEAAFPVERGELRARSALADEVEEGRGGVGHESLQERVRRAAQAVPNRLSAARAANLSGRAGPGAALN